jgi:hypothetical protein
MNLQLVDGPSHGSLAPLTLSGGTVSATYTANVGYVGPDSFTFKVTDGNLDSPVYTMKLDVAAPPSTTPSDQGGGPGPDDQAALRLAAQGRLDALARRFLKKLAKLKPLDRRKPRLDLGAVRVADCPAGCSIKGSVVAAKATGSRVAAAKKLAAVSVVVQPGRTAQVRITLKPAAKRLLVRRRTLRVTVSLTLRDTQKAVTKAVSRNVSLKVKRSRK